MNEESRHRDGGGRNWTNYGQFYRNVFGKFILQQHKVGRVGASLISADQSEGDWSEGPIPDLIVGTLVSETVGGSVDLGAGRIRDPMCTRHFALVAPGAPNEGVVYGRHEMMLVSIPYQALVALAGDDANLPVGGDFGHLHGQYSNCRKVFSITQRLWGIARKPGLHADLAADGTLLELAAALLALGEGTPHSKPTQLATWRLNRATEALADSAPDAISLGDLAELVGLSASHFARSFKASTGLTPHQWSSRHRLSQAEAELMNSRASIADIASRFGFSSQQHFTTAFKHHTGKTPAAWRREQGIESARMEKLDWAGSKHGRS